MVLLPAKNHTLPEHRSSSVATREAERLGLPRAHEPRSNRTRSGSWSWSVKSTVSWMPEKNVWRMKPTERHSIKLKQVDIGQRLTSGAPIYGIDCMHRPAKLG